MIDKQVIYFFIYCVIGWCCEVIYCSIPERKFINRGFLHGPYLPIYGSGALAILSVDYFIKLSPISVFIVGLIVCSFIEYIGSIILEKAFHVKLWDYSSNFGNINGRVCLLNSTLFGLLCVFVVYVFHPILTSIINKIPSLLAYYLSTMIEILLAVDFAFSVVRMRIFSQALDEVRMLTKELKVKMEDLQFEPKEIVLSTRERLVRELNSKKASFALRSKSIFSAYPTMRFKEKDREVELQFQLFKMELKKFVQKGIEEKNKRKERLNIIYENTKSKIKNRR